MQIKERLGVKDLAAVIMNFYSDGIKEYGYLIAALKQNKYWSEPLGRDDTLPLIIAADLNRQQALKRFKRDIG